MSNENSKPYFDWLLAVGYPLTASSFLGKCVAVVIESSVGLGIGFTFSRLAKSLRDRSKPFEDES